MFNPPEVTIGFIKRRPASAARALATLAPEDAAAFLDAIPTRFACSAVSRMNPWPASLIVSALESATAAALLRELEFAHAARILRLVSPAARRAPLAELPQRLRRSFELSLSFPADSVGANMTTDIALLTPAEGLADAQDLVRRAPRHTLELLFVTDAQHRYRGVLHAVDLLRHAGHFSLDDLMDADCPAVPAQARVDRIAGLEAWDDFSLLPVVSRSGELIGALPRKAVRRGESLAGSGAGIPSLGGSLLDAMAVSVTGLAALLTHASPAITHRKASMAADPMNVADALNRQFFVEHPLDAAREIERLRAADVVSAAARQPAKILAPVWQRLLPEKAAELLQALPDPLADRLVEELPPPRALRMLGFLSAEEREARVARLNEGVREDLKLMMSFPPNTAGTLMNTGVVGYRRDLTVGEAIELLRVRKMKTARSLFLVDDEHRLTGKVALQHLAVATSEQRLEELEEPLEVVLRPVALLEEVTAAFENNRVLDIPVIDIDGIFLGAVTHDVLARTVQQDSSVDIQTMVGASKDERALSTPIFAVRKRMPWLQINLLTAFLAAAVVGLFESTIAQVTALAVLLPVVAGQSGNAGAQALAVTMRGLALREITVRQWFRVMRKEVMAGLINGLGVAVTCGLGVYVWSGSLALVGVISASMVLAMIAAGFAGAVIPILLTRAGQDPATSSSIVLTTVTDVAGFFSFLGIATVFMRFL